MFQENKARQIFRKTNISFFGKFGVLCFLQTPILRCALLSYYRHSVIWISFLIVLVISWRKWTNAAILHHITLCYISYLIPLVLLINNEVLACGGNWTIINMFVVFSVVKLLKFFHKRMNKFMTIKTNSMFELTSPFERVTKYDLIDIYILISSLSRCLFLFRWKKGQFLVFFYLISSLSTKINCIICWQFDLEQQNKGAFQTKYSHDFV